MSDILVFSPVPAEALKYRALLERALPGVSIVHASAGEDAGRVIAAAEILFGWKFPEGLLGKAKSLRWIHKVSAGVEDVVSDPDRSGSVRLSRSDGSVIAPRMVEYVLCAIYATTQNLMQAMRQKSDRRWEYYMVGRAAGKTVGIAGLGDIGLAIANALNRNDIRVVGWRRSEGAPPHGVDRIYSGRGQLNDFVSGCDFVVSVLPSTAETRHVFNADVFAAMRPDGVFINIGRGASVDENALAEAISANESAAPCSTCSTKNLYLKPAHSGISIASSSHHMCRGRSFRRTWFRCSLRTIIGTRPENVF